MFTNQLLIAMPSLDESMFEKTVIYVCEHGNDGAVGIIVNRAMEFPLMVVFEQLKIDVIDNRIETLPVLYGGPVQQERGFVLHPLEERSFTSSVAMSELLGLSTSQDMLREIAKGNGPQKFLVSLGYAGWDPEQLDNEIKHNLWLSCEPDLPLLFDTPFEKMWLEAGLRLGVDMSLMGYDAGNA